MLTAICQYLRNWFDTNRYFGSFSVANGAVQFTGGGAIPLLDNQYFRIIGSTFNDGVHQYGNTGSDLVDETFDGAIWAMSCPPAFLELAEEIKTWCIDNAKIISTPYVSESFGGYSYSLRVGSGNGDSSVSNVSWQSQFASRLSPWRKI